MTKKYFKEQTIKELKALKRNATKKELGKLDFNTLTTHDGQRCIYGQMTGHCRTAKAKRLINKCCLTKVDTTMFNIGSTIEHDIKITEKRSSITSDLFSFLESHIITYPQHNKNILAWLKGETKTFPIATK